LNNNRLYSEFAMNAVCDWRKLYKTALLETDLSMQGECIRAAELAISEKRRHRGNGCAGANCSRRFSALAKTAEPFPPGALRARVRVVKKEGNVGRGEDVLQFLTKRREKLEIVPLSSPKRSELEKASRVSFNPSAHAHAGTSNPGSLRKLYWVDFQDDSVVRAGAMFRHYAWWRVNS
jgi:hypothetical protein